MLPFFKDLLYFPYSSDLSFVHLLFFFFFFPHKCYAVDLPVIFLGNFPIAQCTLTSEKFSYSTATVFALVCISVKWLLILSLSLFVPSKFLQATNETKLLIFFSVYYSRPNDCFLYSALHFLQFICVPFAEWDLIFCVLEVISLSLLPEVITEHRQTKVTLVIL